MTNPDISLSGEARLKARRLRFARYVGLAMLAGFAGGIATGQIGALVVSGAVSVSVLVALWAALLIAALWFTRDYFRRIDELDVLDNLWSSTIALYAFFAAAASWYVFHDLGIAAPPRFEVLAIFTFAMQIIAYAARKLGWR